MTNDIPLTDGYIGDTDETLRNEKLKMQAPATSARENTKERKTKFTCRNVKVHYGDFEALHGIDIDIPDRGVTAFIGPSGCGKSTFLRTFNRMNDTIAGCKVSGEIKMDGQDIYAEDLDPVLLRARVGMVFQKPNPFPKSIYDNIAYGPKIHGMVNRNFQARAYQAASSSASSLRGPLPYRPKLSSWMNLHPHLTPSRRPNLKRLLKSLKSVTVLSSLLTQWRRRREFPIARPSSIWAT